MSKYFLIYSIIFLSIMRYTDTFSQKIQPPKPEKVKKELTIHGETRVDNYYWMNERDNPKLLEYLEAENKYTEEMMKHTKPLQEKIFKEITGRIKQDDQSVPYKVNGYLYYTKYETGKEYPLYCRKKDSIEAPEEVMLNINEMAEGYSYFSVAGRNVSPNNDYLAFGVDTLSRRKYDIFIKNLKTGEILKEIIPNTTGSAAWANDNKTLFYTVKDNSLRPYKIYRHKLNDEAAQDREVYHETDDTFNSFIYKSKSDSFLIIGSTSTLSDEYRCLAADDPDGEFRIIQTREKGLEYSVEHFKNEFYIITNYNAKNFRLMTTPVNMTSKKTWKELIPHREDVLLEGIEIFSNFLVLQERSNGLTGIRIIKWSDGTEHSLDFGEEAYSADISINPEFDTDMLRYSYSSLTTPPSTFDYNMVSKEKKLMKQEEVIGGFNPSNYESRRMYASAGDGTKIPVSIVYKKGIKRDGNNPLLLYGYGSYGISQSASFSIPRLSLLDRGFIFAIAHIRGGQEMGRSWYEEGKLLKKKNTFTDFIACAQHLIKENYTNSGKLFAMGGSAGGLLIGAVINMRPDLFKGVIAAVPFVDVVTTMLDTSIPLTTSEFDEWGNPDIKEYYDYILSYSPYDNVAAKNYPAILITTGLHDSQVQYFEPAKWAAKLREMNTGNNPVYLHIKMETGHSGASGRFEKFKETALQYAFLIDLSATEF